MSQNEIIELLEKNLKTFSFCYNRKIEIPFDITAQDFLQFAESDLASRYSHNIINALSNAKRALDCQIDVLLIGFGFYKFANKKNWSFIQKIGLIKELGVIAPRVLSKINTTRNLMEHQFMRPKKETVEDFLDITSLFLASTDKYIFSLPYESGFKSEDVGIVFKLDYKNSCILIRIHTLQDSVIEYDKIKKIDLVGETILSITSTNYLRVMKLYLAKTKGY